jgi:proteasome lid subunit RPN8/RPN11
MIEEIYITEPVKELISMESLSFAFQGVESGGSLIGAKADGRLFITYAVKSGPKARQSAGGLVTDAEYQNDMMERILNAHSSEALQYCGDYHCHPGYGSQLSSIDLNTCYKILADPSYERLGGEFIALLTTVDKFNRVGFHPYVARKVGRELDAVRIDKVRLHTIPADDEMLVALIGESAKPIEERNIPEAKPIHKTGYKEEIQAPEWLIREEQEIQQRYGLKGVIRYYDAEGTPCLEYHVASPFTSTIIMVFPPEYPQNPPSIMYKFDGRLTDFIPKRLVGWNSFWRLANIFDELVSEFQLHSQTSCRKNRMLRAEPSKPKRRLRDILFRRGKRQRVDVRI